MIRKLLLVVVLSVTILLLLSSITVAKAPTIQAHAAILMDAKTGDIIWEKDAYKRASPASTTKILTAIIAIESGRLNEQVIVSTKAAATPGSSMHLYAGQHILMQELLIGLLLRSGNDAAVAIAEHLAGTTDQFAEIMNKKSLAIGAENSHFRNPHGLSSPGHYVTAYDLAWITRYALQNPIFSQIVCTKETTIEWMDKKGQDKEKSLRNTNKLLWMLEDADGVKTGTTGQAGPCLVSSATRDNQKLICVVLDDRSRWYDSMKLLQYGFSKFDLYEYANTNDVIDTIPVENGVLSEMDAIINSPAATVIPIDKTTVQVHIDLPPIIKAPIYKGQKIGELSFILDGKTLKTVDIVAAQECPEKTISKLLFDQLLSMFRFMSRFGAL